MEPGSINAADRFARVSFLINAIPTDLDPHTVTAVPRGTYENQAQASSASCAPLAFPSESPTPSKPNISSTLWRTVWDQKNKVLFFDSATSHNAFWVPLSELDFSEDAPAKKLIVAGGKVFAGNPASEFEPSEPFKFMPADPN
jgi:penicillin V acylase-like amidase (Ntn superfamily)